MGQYVTTSGFSPLVYLCMSVIVNFVFLFGAYRLFGDKSFFFIGLSVLTCAIYHTFLCQSLVCTKMDPIGNKPFQLYGLSMAFESVKMGVGVSFSSSSLAHS